MSTVTFTTPSDDALAEVAGDAAMLSLLRGKPADEAIPTAVWWLVAEALRTTVAARRRIALPPRADEEDVSMLLVEASLLTDAALAELVDSAGLPSTLDSFATAGTRPLFGLQQGTLTLARLLVSHRPTPPQRLAAALSLHADALRRQIGQRQAG
jgi:hypothetical protein